MPNRFQNKMATRAKNTTYMIHCSRFKIITHKCISFIKFIIYHVPQYCPLPKLPNDFFTSTKVPSGLTIQVSDPGSSWSSCFKIIFFKKFFQEHYQCVKQECPIQRGLREFAWTPHSDQIISFSWRYSRKMRSNQQTKLPLFTYEPPLQKSWIGPLVVWIQIRTNILTWVRAVFKGYWQITKVTARPWNKND